MIERGASLVFTDESGFLLLPLVRSTLAPRGKTPLLGHRARHRDKVSVAAALPLRGQVNLYYQTCPDAYVNSVGYAEFLRRKVLRPIARPVVVVHDGGSMHKGDVMRELCGHFPRLDLNLLPPYAPELNPTEQLWNFEKDKELANYVPHNVKELDTTMAERLERIKHNQERLRSFFAAVPLPWDGLTTIF